MMWARGIVLSVLLLGSSALFAHMMYRWVRFLRMGKVMPVKLSLAERLRSFMLNYFGQGRVIREPAGLAHFFFFWGFWIVQIETVEYMIRAFNWKFHWTWFDLVSEPMYNAALFAQDTIGFALIAAVTFAVIRRFVVSPQHVTVTLDGAIILGLETSLIITKYIANGAEIALKAPEALGHNPAWTPLAFAFSQLLGGPGGSLEADALIGPQGTWILHNIGFWCHLGTVAFFLGYIPFGKHMHIIGAAFNVMLRKMEPKGALYPLSFDDEEAEKFGANEIEDLSWKQLLDTYACTECARCQHYCPAYNTGKPLNPMMIIRNVKKHLQEKGEWTLDGKGPEDMATPGHDYNTYSFLEGDVEQTPFPSLLGNVITAEELWACTTCGACVGNCPVFIEHVDTIIDMRRYLVLTEADTTPELTRTFKNMEGSSNPWGISASFRGDWAENLDIPLLKELPTPPEYLFFVGCAGSFDDRQKRVTRSFAKILKEAGVSFGILGGEEKCTGDSARRSGNEYLYQEMAQANIDVLTKYKVTKIITTCPHCFHTIGKEYPQLGGNYEVLHHTELLADLLRTGKIKMRSTGTSSRITYHDSCYIGRWAGIFDAPRDILNAVPGAQPQEMTLNKTQSFCCGAGGARMWMEEDLGQRINVARADQALETKPDVVAVACPFCMTMFDGGLKQRGAEQVKLMDLAEIVEAQMTFTEPEEEAAPPEPS